jgi:hypothetical protein
VVCLSVVVGVDLGLDKGVVLGRELAFVVSFKHEDCLGVGEGFAKGEDAAAGDEGGAFEKKETIERCLAEEVGAAAFVDFAGVRATFDRWLVMMGSKMVYCTSKMLRLRVLDAEATDSTMVNHQKVSKNWSLRSLRLEGKQSETIDKRTKVKM